MGSDERVPWGEPVEGHPHRNRFRMGGFVLPVTVPPVAHLGHPSHGIDPAIPTAVFLAGLLFLAAGVYLDRRPDVASIYADIGFGAAVISVLGAVALFIV